MTRSILASALFACTLSGQVDVTVSRQLMPGATEALFTVDATAVSSTGLPQVAAMLEPVGVRAEHLQRATFQQGASIPVLGQTEPATVTYSFELRVPAARLESLSAEMDRIFREPPAPLTRFNFSARLIPGIAALERARLAALPALFEEARAKAEAALTAAGQSPGAILAMQDEISANYDASATARLSLRMARLTPASGSSSLGRSVAAVSSRPLAVPFDVAAISIRTTTGLEESLRKLAPLGITAANLSSQSSNLFSGRVLIGPSGPSSALSVNSSFEVTRPAAELPRFIEALAKLGIDFSASFEYSNALRAREQEKALPGLLAEARGKAEPLARLLNLALGNPRFMRDGESARTTTFVGVPASRWFLLGFENSFSFGFSQAQPPITLGVEFAVD